MEGTGNFGVSRASAPAPCLFLQHALEPMLVGAPPYGSLARYPYAHEPASWVMPPKHTHPRFGAYSCLCILMLCLAFDPTLALA